VQISSLCRDKVKRLLRRLKAVAAEKSPFTGIGAPRKEAGVNWTRPELVAEIEFAGWMRDGMVRQAAFKGLREDKPAAQVQAEMPAKPAETALPDPAEPAKAVKPARKAKKAREAQQAQPAKAAPSATPPPGKAGGNPVVMAVVISHPGKPLWPDAGDGEPVTKLDLPALIRKSTACADYCDGERPLQDAVKRLGKGRLAA
jgi:bifunctional non-homologous end joining protein LigD